MENTDTVIFDFAGTLVKMRPATLLVKKSFLEYLATKYKLGIVTGGQRTEVLNILSKLRAEKLFPSENIITKDDTNLRKPDPRLLLNLVERLGSKKAIYIGDTEKDRKMANLASVTFLEPGKLLRLRRTL